MLKYKRRGKYCHPAKLKKEFLENLPKFHTIIKTCESIQVCENQYYIWMKSDEEFKNKVEEIRNQVDISRVEICEGKLMKRINADDWLAIKYLLDKKGWLKGYLQKQEIINNTPRIIIESDDSNLLEKLKSKNVE